MNNKVRILRLAKMFSETTDIDHPMTMVKIREYLREQGCIVDRHTLTDDIKVLSEEGYPIEYTRSSRKEYYIENRLFEVEELRMLMDAITCDQAISSEKRALLANKIKRLTSNHYAKLLEYDVAAKEKQPGNVGLFAGEEYTDTVNDESVDKE